MGSQRSARAGARGVRANEKRERRGYLFPGYRKCIRTVGAPGISPPPTMSMSSPRGAFYAGKCLAIRRTSVRGGVLSPESNDGRGNMERLVALRKNLAQRGGIALVISIYPGIRWDRNSETAKCSETNSVYLRDK